MTVSTNTFDVEAGRASLELSRRGVHPDRLVTITIEPEDELTVAHRACRTRFEAAGYTDADLPGMIKAARREANAANQE